MGHARLPELHEFTTGLPDNHDEFGAFVLDTSSGLSAGSNFEFFRQYSGSGTVDWDLSDLVGLELGLQFQLAALPGDLAFDSTLTISNARLDSVSPVPLPPAGISFVLGLGMMGWLSFARRRA